MCVAKDNLLNKEKEAAAAAAANNNTRSNSNWTQLFRKVIIGFYLKLWYFE